MSNDHKPLINLGLAAVASIAIGFASSKMSGLVISKIPHPAAKLVALFAIGGVSLLMQFAGESAINSRFPTIDDTPSVI